MKDIKIANIVFYKYLKDESEIRGACIFYNDGTAHTVSYDEGLDACYEIVKERKITSRDVFREMINREIVHVVSGEEFVRNFEKYVTYALVNREDIIDSINSEFDAIEAKRRSS